MSDLFPPFAPDETTPRRRGIQPVRLRVLVPNLITLFALCLGLSAIRLAIEGKLETAVIAIVIAAVLDGVDGRVARFLKGTSRFGAELDSLADFVNFGVAPAILLYTFALDQMRSLGWIVALVFTVAAALRLARFNVALDDPSRPEWQKNYFVGMAAPAGAITAMLPVYLQLIGLQVVHLAPVIAVYMLLLAFLMVSNLPTFSGKTLGRRIPRQWVLPLFVASVLAVALLASFTFEVMALLTLAYLVYLPFGVMTYRQRERQERGQPAAADELRVSDGDGSEAHPS